MSWLSVCNNDLGGSASPVFELFEQDGDTSPGAGALFAEFGSIERGASTLLRFEGAKPHQWSLALDIDEAGVITLMISSLNNVTSIETQALPAVIGEGLRLWLSWDLETSLLSLCAESRLSGGMVVSNTKLPTSSEIWHQSMATEPALEIAASLKFYALADQAIDFGPMPSLAGDVPIAIDGDWRAIQDIQAGDMVETLDHGVQPVRAIRRFMPPPAQSFQPVRLRAPFFDLYQDILVAPHLRLMLSGDLIEYLFAEEAVLTEARHLIDGQSAFFNDDQQDICFYQLIFDHHVVFNAAGAYVESAFVPDTDPPLVSLNGNGLSHKTTAFQVLKPYEALTLRSLR